jgi:hypothetical protein
MGILDFMHLVQFLIYASSPVSHAQAPIRLWPLGTVEMYSAGHWRAWPLVLVLVLSRELKYQYTLFPRVGVCSYV